MWWVQVADIVQSIANRTIAKVRLSLPLSLSLYTHTCMHACKGDAGAPAAKLPVRDIRKMERRLELMGEKSGASAKRAGRIFFKKCL